MNPEPRTAAPYTRLAEGYDRVMAHVDYAAWADYVHALLQEHAPEARDLLELGAGTAALALVLQPMGAAGGYRYRATDAAAPMLEVAWRKTRAAGVPLALDRVDFLAIPPEPKADAVLLLYDGLNYLLDTAEVDALLGGVRAALRPGGVFLFDQSTPVNSLNHPDGFDDAGDAGAFRYLRTSRYDPEARLHTTTFRLRMGQETITETHVQRAYTKAEIEARVAASGFRVEAAYDGFSLDPAHEASERIHWVLRSAE